MALPDIRRRPGALLVAVSTAHLILISTQVNTRTGSPLFETTVLESFARVARAATSFFDAVGDGANHYAAMRDAEADNRILRGQIADLQVRLQQQRALADQTERLQRLLDLRVGTALETTAARVIAIDATPWFRTVMLDKGSSDGLRRDLAVIAPEGVVGRIVGLAPHAAKVQLLVDRNAAAGASIERSHAEGVASGDGAGMLRMEYVPSGADIREGDLVSASASESIYPKGFAIGRVERIERNGAQYSRVVIRPTVDPAALKEVLIVLAAPRPDVKVEGG